MDHRIRNDGEQSQASSSHQDSSSHSARLNKFLRSIGLSQNQGASQEGQSLNQPANHNEISNLEKMPKDERSQVKQEIRKQKEEIDENIGNNHMEIDEAILVGRPMRIKVSMARRSLEEAKRILECNIYVKKATESDKEKVIAKQIELENARKELNDHEKTIELLKSQQNKLYKDKKGCKDKQLSLEFLSASEDIVKSQLNDGQMLIFYDILAKNRGEENTRYAHLRNTEEYKAVEKKVNDMFQTWKKQNKM